MHFTKAHIMRLAIVLCLACAAALALASCGGSSSSSSHAAATSSIPTSTAATTTTTTTTTASTPVTTTTSSAAGTTQTSSAPSGPTLCRAADLTLSFLGGEGATGHGELGFALRNTSSQTCTTYGYPGVQFLDRAGRALPTVPTHTTQDFFGTLPERPLTVAPGSVVSFRLGVTHGIASTAGCTTAYGLQVIPPNDTSTLRTSIPNGAYECRTATVSPLQPGTSAFSHG